jgi:hypothetical protein
MPKDKNEDANAASPFQKSSILRCFFGGYYTAP